jgi:hypothetical protein
MRLLKVSSLLLLCLGCNQNQTDNAPKLSKAASNIEYVIDERTGLCFVDNTVNDGYNGLGMSHIYTNVPCAQSVINLAKK